ncbi:MAG: RDD family protein [Aeromicrobium sp.]
MTIAGWPRRLGALFIDWFIAVFSSAGIVHTHVLPESPLENLIVTGFFVVEVSVLTGLLGASVGKRLMGLAVVNEKGGTIGVPRALLRSLLICMVFPVLLQTDHRRGLHDVAAGSIVIRPRA